MRSRGASKGSVVASRSMPFSMSASSFSAGEAAMGTTPGALAGEESEKYLLICCRPATTAPTLELLTLRPSSHAPLSSSRQYSIASK